MKESAVLTRLVWRICATSATSLVAFALLASQIAIWQRFKQVNEHLAQISGQLTHIAELLERR